MCVFTHVRSIYCQLAMNVCVNQTVQADCDMYEQQHTTTHNPLLCYSSFNI